MQRGIRFFQSLDQHPGKENHDKKGRNEDLIKQRNEALFHRYYYYQSARIIRYEDIIGQLSNEFFLTTRRIADIIYANTAAIKEIVQAKPSKKELSKRYPTYNWKTPDLTTIQ